MTKPKIIASNIVSWNYNRSHKFLKLSKKNFPHSITVAGGNNLPKVLSDLFFKNHPYIDIAVHGEGEKPFAQVLSTLTEDGLLDYDKLSSIDGISFNFKQEVVRTKPGQPLKNEEGVINIPSPFLSGKFEHYFNEMNKLGEYRGGVWETTRGCPYSCTFCDWGQLTNSKIRKFSDERVFSENRVHRRAF